MRRRLGWLGPACLILLGTTASCGTDNGGGGAAGRGSASPSAEVPAGTGFLDVADLSPAMRHHFTKDAVQLKARLALRPNGCVTVVVDGVERLPLWPDGTDVAQQPGQPDRYVVTLPGGMKLTVNGPSGDEFSARGIVDDNAGPFEAQAGDPPTKVGSFLAYCGVEALPVAFPDATTFTVQKS